MVCSTVTSTEPAITGTNPELVFQICAELTLSFASRVMKSNCKRESHSPNGDNSTVAEAPSQKRDKLKLKEEWQPLKNENVFASPVEKQYVGAGKMQTLN